MSDFNTSGQVYSFLYLQSFCPSLIHHSIYWQLKCYFLEWQQILVKSMFLNLTVRVLIPLLPLFTWVTLDKLLNLFMVTLFIGKIGIIVLTSHMAVVSLKWIKVSKAVQTVLADSKQALNSCYYFYDFPKSHELIILSDVLKTLTSCKLHFV